MPDQRDTGDECCCVHCVAASLGLMVARSFEDHMRPDVVWTEHPAYARAFDVEVARGVRPA